MNIMNKLTLRLLKENKRRTIVTIIGVIISVAMLTAVSTLAVSFVDLLKRQEITDTGEWHALYENVTPEQIQGIKDDKDTKDIIFSRDIGYAKLDGSTNQYRPYVFIKSYNEKGFENFRINLVEGELPKAANEIVISEQIQSDAKVSWQIGDIIPLEIGKRIDIEGFPLTQEYSFTYAYDDDGKEIITEKLNVDQTEEFKVVGIIERPNWERYSAPGYTVLNYLDENNLTSADKVNASVVWHNVTDKQVDRIIPLAKKLNIEEASMNDGLLRYYGILSDGMTTTLYSLSAIIMGIIIFGSVSLIYNAFAISVSERSRYLGMLASVGATRQQKRASVFFEGAVIGAISIPIGIIAGLGGIGITFIFINNILQSAFTGITEKITVVATPMSIIVAVLVSVLTIFISTYLPARRASKISAIDAIRQTEDVKLTGKKLKTSRIVRKLFGIEAEFGLKNLKRNKRRYQITVFSLVVSIILFLSVSYFTFSLKQSLDVTQDELNYDISVSKGAQSDKQWESLVNKTISLDEVTGSGVNYTSYLHATFAETDVPENLHAFAEDGNVERAVRLIALDDRSLREYGENAGIQIDKLLDKNQESGVLINEVSYYTEDEQYALGESLLMDVGESVDLFTMNYETDEQFYLDTISIADVTKERPTGVQRLNSAEVTFIVSEQTFKQINTKNNSDFSIDLYVASTDPVNTETFINENREVGIHINNHYAANQEEKQFVLLLSIFTYGFIALITAISIANIFNTISTSISLRKREFAMLKSIGMTPKGFNKMINYESIFYGIKSLLYGIPISIGLMLLMHRALDNSFVFKFQIPWGNLLIVVIGIFLIVSSAMLYSSSKIKKDNIIDALKQENM